MIRLYDVLVRIDNDAATQGHLVLTFTPLYERGLGGFRDGCLRQIPPHPPLPKGGTEPGDRKLHDPGGYHPTS
jgi:hypothetical protein